MAATLRLTINEGGVAKTDFQEINCSPTNHIGATPTLIMHGDMVICYQTAMVGTKLEGLRGTSRTLATWVRGTTMTTKLATLVGGTTTTTITNVVVLSQITILVMVEMPGLGGLMKTLA